MTPLHQNSQTSSFPWEWAFSRPGTCRRGPWSRLTYPTIRLFCWANPENFSLFHAADQKLFHFYHQTDRQTHRHTDAHFASLYARARFFSIWKFIPFTTLREWVSFAHSLTSFVKDNILMHEMKRFENTFWWKEDRSAKSLSLASKFCFNWRNWSPWYHLLH